MMPGLRSTAPATFCLLMNNNAARFLAASALAPPSYTANDVYTLAGTGTAGTSGNSGQASDAKLKNPQAVVFDSSGDEYIADGGNNRVQEVAATSHTQWGVTMTAGDVYTIAGSAAGTAGSSGDGGASTSAKLSSPDALAFDSGGDLYIADYGNSEVREIAATTHSQWGHSMTANDIYSIIGNKTWGDSANGTAIGSAEFQGISGLAVDGSGNLYLSDSGNNRVVEAAVATGTQWGSIAETANEIFVVAGNGTAGHAGDGGVATSAELSNPYGITFDSSGDLYIADASNDRVQEVAATTGTQWGQSMTADDAYTVADKSDGTGNLNANGTAMGLIELNFPSAVAFDNSGNLYINDDGDSRVLEIPAATGTNRGIAMTADDSYTVAGNYAGTGGYSGDGGAATSGTLYNNAGMALDSAGDVLIADDNNNAARFVAAGSGGSETVTTPSGYTLQTSESTGSTATYLYTHTVGSGDTSVMLSYSSAAPKAAVLAVYRNVNTTTPIDASSSASTSSGTSVTAPSLTTTAAGDELVAVAGAGQLSSATTWTAPSGMAIESKDTSLTTLGTVLTDEIGPATPGSSGTEVVTSSQSGQLTALLVALMPSTVSATTAYDADNQATLDTDPDGNGSLTCYDGDGNVAETVPPVGVAANSLTAASCPTSYPSDYGDRLATDATTTAYDALGHKTTVTTPAPAGQSGYETTTYGYDSAGNETSITAPPTSTSGGAPNQVTDYTYDAAGQLATTTTGAGTAAVATTLTCYDPDGNKTATVPGDGNATTLQTCSSSSPYDTSSSYQTTYSYDSLGQVVSTTAPATTWAGSGQTTTKTYDAVGNVATSEDANGVTTTYTYSPLGQMTTTSYSDGTTHEVTDTYDADGNRTQMVDASGTSSYTYDPFGEMTSDDNGAGKTVDYSYSSLGDPTAVTYPLGTGATWATTNTVAYTYDAANQMTSLTDFNGNTISASNTADGQPSSLTLGGSGDTISTSYDSTDRPSSITLANSSSTLQEFAYSDEPSSAIASETDTPSSSTSPADYTYDANSRVTSFTPGTGSTDSYAYDDSDNLTTLPTGATGTYDHASELTSSALSGTTTSYTYDAAGNRTGATVGGTATVGATYNGADELTSYSNSAANTSSATYDGDGLRSAATSTPTGGSASTDNFVWNSTSSVPQLLMDSANAYLYGPNGTPIEQVGLSSGTVQFLTTDALGSVRGVVAAGGSLTASTAYDAEGNPETSGGLSSYTPLGFAGAYTDPTGLLYLVHRYYDPSTGQFLSVDPLLSQTGAPYSYAGSDPVNKTDPSGEISVGLCAGPMGHVAFVQLAANECLTEIVDGPNQGQIGFVGTVQGGFGLGLEATVDAFVQVSNATDLSQLAGPFTYIAGSAALGGGGAGVFFWNNHVGSGVIVGGDVGVSIGAGLSGVLGESDSWVTELGGWFGWEADLARSAFSLAEKVLLPNGINTGAVIADARAAANLAAASDGPQPFCTFGNGVTAR